MVNVHLYFSILMFFIIQQYLLCADLSPRLTFTRSLEAQRESALHNPLNIIINKEQRQVGAIHHKQSNSIARGYSEKAFMQTTFPSLNDSWKDRSTGFQPRALWASLGYILPSGLSLIVITRWAGSILALHTCVYDFSRIEQLISIAQFHVKIIPLAPGHSYGAQYPVKATVTKGIN